MPACLSGLYSKPDESAGPLGNGLDIKCLVFAWFGRLPAL